jgi:hypothetical protein
MDKLVISGIGTIKHVTSVARKIKKSYFKPFEFYLEVDELTEDEIRNLNKTKKDLFLVDLAHCKESLFHIRVMEPRSYILIQDELNVSRQMTKHESEIAMRICNKLCLTTKVFKMID